MIAGAGFLIEGTAEQGAGRLNGASVVTVGPAPEAPDEPVGPGYPTGEREAVAWRS